MELIQNETVYYNITPKTEGEEAYPEYYDSSIYPYPLELQTQPFIHVVAKISVYVIIILTALVGNVLVILVVVKNKRMRTTTNYFIVNLAVSDLMVIAWCCWVYLVDDLSEGWILGNFFCKFNSFAQGMYHFLYIVPFTIHVRTFHAKT